MRRLSLAEQDYQRIESMKKACVDIVEHFRRSVVRGSTDEVAVEPLEVNVIFTQPSPTAAAPEGTESFARGIVACVRIRAAIVVPWQLPPKFVPEPRTLME